MRPYKYIEYPSLEEYMLKVEDAPLKCSCISTEFMLNCLVADEINHLRFGHKPDGSYVIHEWLSRTFRIWGGFITIRYPRFEKEKYHFKALELAEELETRFKLDVSLDYIFGDSDRDLAMKYSEEGTPLSKSSVSYYYIETLKNELSFFRNRSLADKFYICLQIDAMYVSVRNPDKSVEKQALMRCIGLNLHTLCWELVDIMVLPGESITGYQIFFEDMLRRGLNPPYLITTDAHLSFASAIFSLFMNVQWQLCRFHDQKGITPKLKKDVLKQLNLSSKKHSRFVEHALVKLFRSIHDDSPNFETSLYRTEYLLSCLHVSDEMRDAFGKRLLETFTYKIYPKSLSKEISTTNQAERLNLEDRRRFEVIGTFPNGLSVERLSLAVNLHTVDDWSQHPQCTMQVALEASRIHDQLVNKVFNLVKNYVYSFNLQKVSLVDTAFKVLWCHIFPVPVRLDDSSLTTLSVGFFCIHGITLEGETRLVYFSPLKNGTKEEFIEAANTLDKQGLNKNAIKLIVQDTYMPLAFKFFPKCFPKGKVMISPDSILERLEYLAKGFDEQINKEFLEIYNSKSQSIALTKLKLFKDHLGDRKFNECLHYLDYFKPKDLIGGLTILKKKQWQNFNIFELSPYPQWLTHLKDLRNNPKSPEETVKELIATLKRKKRESASSSTS